MELTTAQLWARIQEVARDSDSVSEIAFRTWIASAKPLTSTSDELVLEAQNPFHVEWLEDKFGSLLAAAGKHILGRPLHISVTCSSEPTQSPIPSMELTPSGGEVPSSNLPDPLEHRKTTVPSPPLNHRYTFDHFVVGDHNQLAVAASKAAAEKPAKLYNPLFLYGGVGLGKTHLMHAIGHQVLADDPSRRVSYISSEQFTNELITSIREGSMASFRSRYRKMDLLLVDDIHFLEGKESTQEEFFHTFNALHDAQRQIVLTCDRPPKEMARLEERLISRFEWGLLVDIRPPDFETRVAILRKKAEDDGLGINDEVIEFVAHSCTASVRELEGAVIKLLAYSSLTTQEITLDLARTALQGMLGRRDGHATGPVLSPERIREVVAQKWRVRTEALASKGRSKDVTLPRQVAMYLIKHALDISLVRIGEYFGGRDHSTVIHSIRKVEEEMARDPAFRHQVESALAEVTETTNPSIHRTK